MTKSSASSEFDVYELFRMEVGNVGDTIWPKISAKIEGIESVAIVNLLNLLIAPLFNLKIWTEELELIDKN